MNKTHRILLKSVSKGLNKGCRDQGILSANSEIESSVPVNPFVLLGPLGHIHREFQMDSPATWAVKYEGSRKARK